MFRWVMAIVKPKKENHMFACLPLLVWLLVPPAAAAATAGASGGGWDIGDGDVDSDSLMDGMGRVVIVLQYR